MPAGPDAPPRRGRPPLTDEQRRRQRLEISRHAVRLFREQGVADTTGEQIADAAGVSERTLWRWFRAKEACVEPLLTTAVESFTAVVRSWPEDVELGDHLHAVYTVVGADADADAEAVLAVVRMTHDEPGLRAVWLVLHERSEQTFAAALADRLGLPADALEIRVQAAAVNSALRVMTDELAAAGVASDASMARHRDGLAAALRVLTRLPHEAATGD